HPRTPPPPPPPALRAAHIPPLSLHDALPISSDSTPPPAAQDATVFRPAAFRELRQPSVLWGWGYKGRAGRRPSQPPGAARPLYPDRKSTRLNSSHVSISYAVFCLKKKITSKQ